MTNKEKVIKELDRVPVEYYDILIRFLNALADKPVGSATETPLMSESSLAKDWLKPEEDKAWADL
jgi:hypothetical protein